MHVLPKNITYFLEFAEARGWCSGEHETAFFSAPTGMIKSIFRKLRAYTAKQLIADSCLIMFLLNNYAIISMKNLPYLQHFL